MTDSIAALLAERESTHGDFAAVAAKAQAIKSVLASHSLPPVLAEAVDMIASKLARIASGSAVYRDHWDDIAGYAQLAAERLPEAVS